jgi:peptide/nickel transport system permease protein
MEKSIGKSAFWRTFKRQRMGLTGLAVLLAIVSIALLAPWLAPYDPTAAVRVSITGIYAAPDASHLLGTDDAGKDVLSSLIYGARTSLSVGLFAALISLLIGGTIGIVAGFSGGRVDNLLMRFTDMLLVVPDLPLMIILVALLGRSLWVIIVVLGVLGWTGTARVVRAQTLALKQRVFVRRTRALGAGPVYIMRRHIPPQVLPLLVVNGVLAAAGAVYNESVLGFLGLGDPTRLSWGQMLNFAFSRGAMSAGAWWVLLAPGLAIVWVVLGLTLLGNGLERVFNPRLERHHLSPAAAMLKLTGSADSKPG